MEGNFTWSIEEKDTLQLGPRINQMTINKRIVCTLLVWNTNMNGTTCNAVIVTNLLVREVREKKGFRSEVNIRNSISQSKFNNECFSEINRHTLLREINIKIIKLIQRSSLWLMSYDLLWKVSLKRPLYHEESLSLKHCDPIELLFARAYVLEYFTSVNV